MGARTWRRRKAKRSEHELRKSRLCTHVVAGRPRLREVCRGGGRGESGEDSQSDERLGPLCDPLIAG